MIRVAFNFGYVNLSAWYVLFYPKLP